MSLFAHRVLIEAEATADEQREVRRFLRRLLFLLIVALIASLMPWIKTVVRMAYANDLRVTWINPVTGDPATEIRIERSLHCSGRYPWEEIAVLPPSATSYYDAGLQDGEEYCYRLRHCNAQGCGGYTVAVGQRVRRLPKGEDFQMSGVAPWAA